MSMYCDNQASIHIAFNHLFRVRTKHMKQAIKSIVNESLIVDYHIIRERVEKAVISTLFVCPSAQLADMFTKPLFKPRLELLCNKLGLCNIYFPA